MMVVCPIALRTDWLTSGRTDKFNFKVASLLKNLHTHSCGYQNCLELPNFYISNSVFVLLMKEGRGGDTALKHQFCNIPVTRTFII